MHFYLAAFLVIASFVLNQRVFAQGDKTINVSAPLSLVSPELTGHLEMRAADIGSVAFEYIFIGEREEYSEEFAEDNQASLETKGYEVALQFSRFSEPMRLAGFFWTLGTGYRVLDVKWSRPRSEWEGLSLDSYDGDEDAEVSQMTASGMTGHARVGYRWVAQSVPLVIGGYFGLRHFENKFKDKDNEDNGQETTTDERNSLRRVIMTRPEAAFELGMIF